MWLFDSERKKDQQQQLPAKKKTTTKTNKKLFSFFLDGSLPSIPLPQDGSPILYC